jgi:hypothetical protein
VSHDVDPPPALERLQHTGGNRNAANGFDVPARDRLAIGNDGKCLEHRARVLGRLLRIEPVQIALHFRPGLEAPAAGHCDQLDPATLPVVAQVVQHAANDVGADLPRKQPAELGDAERLLAGEQRRLEDPLELGYVIHRRLLHD